MSDLAQPWPDSDHAQRRTVILPRRTVLFVPMPKAGCTSVLWWLAAVSGQPRSAFVTSLRPQVTATMTIHDLGRWRPANRWFELSDSERDRIAEDPAWLRFTVVRDPAKRLWSGWQSKLLMREPDFVNRFGQEPWFPRVPVTAKEVVEDFRTFVRALAGHDGKVPLDPHWLPQTVLLQRAPELTHVGRTEQLAATLTLVQQHCGTTGPLQMPRENSGLLPYHPGVYDREALRILADRYHDDFDTYSYHPPDLAGEEWFTAWQARVEPLLPAIGELVERHDRIGTLLRVARKAQRAADAKDASVDPS